MIDGPCSLLAGQPAAKMWVNRWGRVERLKLNRRDKWGVDFVVVNHLSFLRQACPEGFFGVECQSICNCGSGSTCNHETGQCTCPPGQMGSLCDHSCPSGTWGNDCSRECECDNDADCDPVSGTCICPAGYRGAKCEESESSSCLRFVRERRNSKRPRPPHSKHLLPHSARFGYATEGALFISAQLSTDVVSALWKVQVLIWLCKQPSAQVRT